MIMPKNMRSPMESRVIEWVTAGISRVFVYANNYHSWAIGLRAKIDTGADRCSIDDMLAQALGLELTSSVTVKNANGRERRNVYNATIKFEGEKYEVSLTGSDRNELECPILLGRDLLKEICLTEEE